MLVTSDITVFDNETALPLSTVLVMISPTYPAAALSLVAVPLNVLPAPLAVIFPANVAFWLLSSVRAVVAPFVPRKSDPDELDVIRAYSVPATKKR